MVLLSPHTASRARRSFLATITMRFFLSLVVRLRMALLLGSADPTPSLSSSASSRASLPSDELSSLLWRALALVDKRDERSKVRPRLAESREELATSRESLSGDAGSTHGTSPTPSWPWLFDPKHSTRPRSG